MNGNTSTSSDNCPRENDSVPIVASFKPQTHCIFCAKDCPPAFVIENGKLKRMKEEMELNSYGCEDVILARQLRAINIMRNILDIRGETCSKLLAQFDGQFNPEFWVKVCVPCKVFVEEIDSTRREVARLEKKAKQLKEKLKGFISMSNQDEELDVDSLVWREIREEVLAGFEPTPPEPLIIEDEEQQEEPQVDVQMEIEVEPEFRVKTELQEEPESFTRVTRQRTVKAQQAATNGKRKKVGASKKIKTGTATETPMATEGTGEIEANSVEPDIEPEVENSNDTITEQIPVQVNNETTHAAGSENLGGSVKTISSLPDKILDSTLGYSVGKDLLKNRLVPSQWKAELNGVMEQKLLSFFTKWNTHKSYHELGLDTLIPPLWINVYPRNLKWETVAEQHAIAIKHMNILFTSKSFKGLQNPFPSSSLRLGMRTRKFHLNAIPTDRKELEIFPLLKNYGHFLTTVVLDGYQEHASKFAELLSHLPNLKSLTLEAVQFYGDEHFTWDVAALPSLQYLTHLHCVSVGSNFSTVLPPEPLLWILEKYGYQLIGLTVRGEQYVSFKQVEKFEKTIQYKHLKQLKIDSNNAAILKLTREAKLSHIMVQSCSEDKNSLLLMLPLIGSFSKTLEYLWCPSEIGECGQNDGEVVAFPKLKELAIRVPNQESEMLDLQILLQTRFCKVEKLEFVYNIKFSLLIELFVNVGEFWKLLPKLKAITYFDDDEKVEESRRSIHARSHVVWKSIGETFVTQQY